MRRHGKGLTLATLIFLAAVGWQVAGGVAPAAAAEPLTELRAMVDRIMEILNDEKYQPPEMHAERRRLAIAVGNNYFDYRAMSQSALARLWRDRTEAERQRFVALFTRLVEQVYIIKAIDAYEGQEILVKDQRVQGDRAEVYSVVINNGKEIPIIYKLNRQEDRWLIYDVLIEGVSLIANYRRQFQSSKSFEAVIDWLERTVNGTRPPE